MSLDAVRSALRASAAPPRGGRVLTAGGALIVVALDGAKLGDLLEVVDGDALVPCEVVGFVGKDVRCVPLRPLRAVAPGAAVWRRPARSFLPVGEALLGRLVDAFGQPLDGLPVPRCSDRVIVDALALPIVERAEVEQRFDTGLRVIDGMLTCGRGQRIGIFAGAGCGKSVLVEQIASQSAADVVVIGLVGERGREVRELLGSKARAHVIGVAASADRPALERVRAAQAATAIAEYFRDRGRNVLLVIDSLTRYAMALREIGLTLGEVPATKGYPPSVFAALPRLLERVAPTATGAITAFYTVLVEGDDLADPVADAARSLLDAHIVLSRDLAGRGHFPAVDILASASRVARRVATPEATHLAERARELLARRRQVAELQSLGAYTPGTNPAQDAALAAGDRLDAWARQPTHLRIASADALSALGVAVGEEPKK